ncbi:hypothetical protein Tco_0432949 [Tanacetum coccineum]
MSSNTFDYIYPIIVPSDVDVEDAFSSKTTPNYTPASPDYSPASLGNTSPDPSDDLSKYLLASLAISPFHDDPYMKTARFQREQIRHDDEIVLARVRVSTLEMIIEDIQVRHRSDIKNLLDKILEILERIGEVSYRLALPPQLSHVHDVFHETLMRDTIIIPLHAHLSLSVQPDMSFVRGTVIHSGRQERVMRNKVFLW